MSANLKQVGGNLVPPVETGRVDSKKNKPPLQVLSANTVGQAALLELPLDILRIIAGFAGKPMRIVCRRVCKRLQEANPLDHDRKKICALAAAQGYLKIVTWARTQGFRCDSSICNSAAQNGHLKVLKWAKANGVLFSNFTMGFAALGGHLDVLRWHYARSKPEDLVASAGAYGAHLEVIKWLQGKGFKFEQKVPLIVQQVTRGMEDWGILICYKAACTGKLETLRWARAEGMIAPPKVMGYAAYHGHHNIVQWDFEVRKVINTQAAAGAAFGSHLPLLEFLRKAGMEWTRPVEVFFLRDSRVLKSTGEKQPWGEQIYYHAAINGNLEVIKWAHAQGVSYDPCILLAAALRSNHLKILQWLRREAKIAWDTPAFDLIHLNGVLTITNNSRSLIPHSCTFYERVCDTAKKNHQVDVLAWAQVDFLS